MSMYDDAHVNIIEEATKQVVSKIGNQLEYRQLNGLLFFFNRQLMFIPPNDYLNDPFGMFKFELVCI